MALRKNGWLKVRETGDPESKPRWCVLDNGVLWLYKKPGDQEGREVIPLHDAVVGNCEPPAPLQLAVRCRRSGRVLALTTLTKEDYTAWMMVLNETVREWREKRRASVLNRQLMALDAENKKNGIENNLKNTTLLGDNLAADLIFTTRRRSEVPQTTSRPMSSNVYHLVNPVAPAKRLPLKQLVANAKAPLRWSKLTEVIESGLLGLLTEEQVAMEELKFSALVEELRFNAELQILLRLALRAVSWPDSLPAFNRRCIVLSLAKVKRSSDNVLRKAEGHWAQRVTMQSTVFALLGTDARVAGWCQAYTDYCLYLDELRELFKRSAQVRNNLVIESSRYGLELALVPIQHLTTLRQLLQTIFELLPPDSSEHSSARETRDFLNEILDSCYEELTEQSGSEYVAEMDNILQFDLSAVTPGVPGPPLLFKQRGSPPSREGDDDDVMGAEEEKQIIRKMTKSSRPSLFTGVKSAAQFIRRRTEEGLGLKENRRASLPAVMITLPDPKSSADTSSDEEEQVETEAETTGSDVMLAVPRYFCFEPLYQEYYLALAEDIIDRTLGRIEEEDMHIKRNTKHKGCTRWSKNPRVLDAGLLDTLSEDQRSLMEAKFEVIVSEAAFLRSLRTLESHFAHCPEFYDEEILPPVQRHLFFSGVEAHRASSERLLASLERHWRDDVSLEDVCSILHSHMASPIARVAATACLNQLLVAHLLQNLMSKPEFARVLTGLEASIACKGFTLLSFLTLPLKRLGRIKLILENISRIMTSLPEVKIAERAACESGKEAVGRLISRAETAAKRALSDAALQELAQKLSFRRVPRLALSAEGRALIHRGAWRVLGRREDSRGGMRAKTMYPDLQAYLLSDLLVLSAPDGAGDTVVDYCACLEMVLCTAGPGMEEPLPGFLEKDPAAKYALYVKFKNHAGKMIELIVGCSGAADRERWLRAHNSEPVPPSPVPGARQPALVQALRPHAPRLPDEANLATGDIIGVTRNPGDGWMLGRSILDGTGGWFPTSLTVQLSAGRKSVTFLVSDLEKSRFSLA